MSRAMLNVVMVIVLVYIGLATLVFVSQRSLIYFPPPPSPRGDVTTLVLPVDEARIEVSARQRRGSRALIYFGGNAEDVAWSLPGLAAAFPDHALYLMHYRGYGGSTGKPSEAALVADALVLFDHVRAEHAQVVVVGRSLGAGVALRLASDRPVARLVLVTPFDSLLDLARRQFPWLPVRWLLLDRYESAPHAPRIEAPTLLVAAEHDRIVPRASTDALLARFRPGVASLAVVSGSDHNDLDANPAYRRLLASAALP